MNDTSQTAVSIEKTFIFQKLVGFAHCHGIDTKIGSHLPYGGKGLTLGQFPFADAFYNLVAKLQIQRNLRECIDFYDHENTSLYFVLYHTIQIIQ